MAVNPTPKRRQARTAPIGLGRQGMLEFAACKYVVMLAGIGVDQRREEV
jgi:hypothetical protein